MMTDGPRAERPLSELFRELSQDTSTLIRQEMALGRAELMQRVNATVRDTIWIAIGAALAWVALLALTATLILGIVQLGLQPWLSAGLVALVFAIIGGVLVQSGISAMKKRELTPVETVESIKETAQWLKNQTR